MRALLDVNVLIALLDGQHLHHELAWRWLRDNIRHGWATCSLTRNGCVRVMSRPKYPNSLPPRVVAGRLRDAVATDHHRYWTDEVNLLDPGIVDWGPSSGRTRSRISTCWRWRSPMKAGSSLSTPAFPPLPRSARATAISA